MCSCNGLILLGAEPYKYMLWNPFIRKHITIPPFNPDTHPQAFVPDTDPIHWMHHLYFDSSTEDYKILLVYENCYTVYSCKNGSWDIKDFPHEFNVLVYGASVDGCIYLRKGDEIIEYLDARDGKLHTFRQPDGVESLIEGELKKVSGRLSLTGLSEDHLRLQMWVMEKNGSSEKCWRKVISMGEEDAGLLDLSPVCLSAKDLVVLCSMVPIIENGKFMNFIYNPRDNSFQETEFICKDNTHYFPYSETRDIPSPNV